MHDGGAFRITSGAWHVRGVPPGGEPEAITYFEELVPDIAASSLTSLDRAFHHVRVLIGSHRDDRRGNRGPANGGGCQAAADRDDSPRAGDEAPCGQTIEDQPIKFGRHFLA